MDATDTTKPNDIPAPNLNAAARDGFEATIAAHAPSPTPPPAGAKAAPLDEAARKRAAHERALADAKPLGAAEIVRRRPTRTEWVLVPHLGGKVLVRALSASERDEFETSLVKMRGKERTISTSNIRAKLCALAIVDPLHFELNGEAVRAFSDEQIAELGAVDAGEMSKIYDKAAELSGITEADVEELAGNSNSAASAGSSSK
jgi:hypothetical protein